MTWQGEKFKGKLGFTMAESKPSWRTPPRPPEGSPNVIMIALNVLGEILRRQLKVYLVSGSSAFTHGMRRILGQRLDGLVRFTDFFWNAAPDSIDVLIVDEAHRVRAKSEPKVLRELRPKIGQVEELIRAARVAVFFADENQIISPDEVGEPAAFRDAAWKVGANFRKFYLAGQFRCNGSDAYLTWLDDVLELTDRPQRLKLSGSAGFDLKLVDRPADLWDEIRVLNRQEPGSARLVAGWCWPWSDPGPTSLVEDVVIGNFRMPWESKLGKRPPPGIPEAKYWALEPAGPVLRYGLQQLHGGRLILPRANGQWPSTDALQWRFERFKAAA